MPWKKEEDGSLALGANGNPIWLDASGNERAIDEGTFKAHAAANREAAERRERIAELEAERDATAKAWEGLDPEEARKGAAELKRLKAAQKKAGEGGGDDAAARAAQLEEELDAERARAQTAKAEHEKAAKELDGLRASVRRSTLASILARSKYFAIQNGQDAPLSYLTPDAALPIIGDYLDVADHDQVVGLYPKGHPDAGKKIRNRDGEIARGDEIMEALFESVDLLKPLLREVSTRGSGSGAGNGSGTSTATTSGKRWHQMTFDERAAFAQKHGAEAAKQKLQTDAAHRQEAQA